jgi:hypothetical protein
LRDVYDPAVLPLLAQYVRHPQLDTHWLASGRSGYGFGITAIEGYGVYNPFPWGKPPAAVTILLGIAEQGNKEALRLLDSCLASHDRDVRIYGALALNGFNPKPAIEALRREAGRVESADIAVEALVKLGDAQAIGILIEKLASDKQRNREYRQSQDYKLLLQYTQENIPYDSTMTLWRNWWKQHNNDFAPRRIQAEIDDRFNFNISVSP